MSTHYYYHDLPQAPDEKVQKRYVTRDIVIGVDGYGIFNLKKGQEIEILDKDIYGRVKIIVQEKTAWVFTVMLESISSIEI